MIKEKIISQGKERLDIYCVREYFMMMNGLRNENFYLDEWQDK